MRTPFVQGVNNFGNVGFATLANCLAKDFISQWHASCIDIVLQKANPKRNPKDPTMRQAITTKFIGPTNTRGSRVKATSASGHTLTRPWDYAEEVNANHGRAALALATKLGWHGRWIAGGMGDKAGGNVYVKDDGDAFTVQASKLEVK